MKPAFSTRVFFDMEKTNHAMCAGGGDWNQDGIRDFLHMPFAGGSYKVFKGEAVPAAAGATGAGLKFAEGGLKSATVLKFAGDVADRASANAWAWDFSGSAKTRGAIEYVGSPRGTQEICFYEIADGASRKLAVLAKADGQYPQLTVSDLNADGKMDILFSSGCFNNEKEKTKIYVMYGKSGKQ